MLKYNSLSATRPSGCSTGIYRQFGKRVLDLFLIMFSLPAIIPFLIVVSYLVKKKIGTPVLFQQKRPGLRGEPFVIQKFKTMTDQRDETGRLLPDANRMTALGRKLRNMSLDELPELYNVIKGEMSIVGPRPLLMHYLDRYTPEQMRRHNVLPGITGWAQVNGRNHLSWEEKFARDVWYVDHVSFGLDLEILFRTVADVLCQKGICQPGHDTCEEFRKN